MQSHAKKKEHPYAQQKPQSNSQTESETNQFLNQVNEINQLCTEAGCLHLIFTDNHRY